jgi:outer membrane immunogenic protein
VATAAAFGIVLPPTVFLPFTANLQGVIGGAHVGYNLQFNQWVVGLEGSVDGKDLNKTVFAGAFCPLFCGNVTTKVENSRFDPWPRRRRLRPSPYLRHRRCRLRRHQELLQHQHNNPRAPGRPLIRQRFENSRGLDDRRGLEYAVTNNWSVRAEYRYSDFGSFNDFSGTALFPGSFIRHRLTEHQVQAGFSYKFDTFAPYPVVARY